ncbi:universal stress protein [Natrinema sp. 1APR25-10V2]|uniref:universal stress protein n=1 Tax=Natrinema sp. 1APR25-10V2 TaxID=2951081 RepID=UPI0028752BB8|nr:universal stress protein [Natrinema sp. 1APR25-10V2]MDS0476189.1 universal stress protein [Natrinema sp. 1APR25-10V2]
MYDDILIPTDGGKQALKGAEHGVELAASVGATIHALYVIELPGAPRTTYIMEDEERVREEYREYGEEVTTEVCEMAAEAGVDCVTAVKTGSAHEEIKEYSEEEDIDLIVVGTRYQGKFGALMGSNAEKVVRTSEIPVITVRVKGTE